MFEAYSIKKRDKISIDDVVDLSDTFKCLNPECKAEFSVKGLNSGIVSKHFARKKTAPHIKGCPYTLFSSNYIDNADMVKADLFEIYEHTANKNTAQSTSTGSNNKNAKTTGHRITTPKQLLNFCISNRLSTEYKDGITVNGIIIDERNLLFASNFEGFNGLRLVVGHTYRFDDKSNILYMYVTTKTKNGKTVKLNVAVSLDTKQLSEIVEYILETYNNTFANHAIAVFEIWETESKYNVKCTISQKKNIIYKFATE